MPDGVVADFELWIRRGAPDPRTGDEPLRAQRPATESYDYSAGRQHWAYRRMAEPEPPTVVDQAWVSRPLDRFVLARMEQRGLTPVAPVAGLIKDLESRGLLEETLVLWGGEFGRTPGAEAGARNGRDHNPHGYTMFMAGGGVKGGHSHGRTDDYGYYAIEDKVHIHDLHATILHLLGLDHERLTYKSQGRDFRLTDVEGVVVRDIIA